MVDKNRTIQQRTPPWWSWSPVQRHGFFAFPAAPPRYPLGKGLTKGGVAGVLLNNTNRPRKKLVTKLNDFNRLCHLFYL